MISSQVLCPIAEFLVFYKDDIQHAFVISQTKLTPRNASIINFVKYVIRSIYLMTQIKQFFVNHLYLQQEAPNSQYLSNKWKIRSNLFLRLLNGTLLLVGSVIQFLPTAPSAESRWSKIVHIVCCSMIQVSLVIWLRGSVVTPFTSTVLIDGSVVKSIKNACYALLPGTLFDVIQFAYYLSAFITLNILFNQIIIDRQNNIPHFQQCNNCKQLQQQKRLCYNFKAPKLVPFFASF